MIRGKARCAGWALCALLAMLFAIAPTPAGAAVGYRNQTCKSQTLIVIGSFSMNKPAGVVAGDIMIATVRSTAFLSFNFTTPSGWTEIAGVSDNDAKLYYRVAGASEPASYTFASVLGVTATMDGSIVAFSGVDAADPIASSAKSTGSGTGVSLPGGTATRNGSAVYSNVTSAANTTSTFASLTDACDQSGGGVAVANAWRSVSAGPVSGQSATLSVSTSWIAQTLVLQPASLCATGGLTLTPPSSISLGTTVLDGTNKTATASGTFGVSDMTDTAVGWNLTGTSTQFTNGSQTLAANATTITGLSVTAGGTNCGMPATVTTAFPITLPAGPTAPVAAKIYSDAVGAGLGAALLQYAFSLAIPGNARIGTYTSTWTFTLGSGP